MIGHNKGLSYVTVNKEVLLEHIRTNRNGHRDMFLKAIEGYRAAVIKELEMSLALAKEGKSFRRVIELEEPRDHTKDYDRIIKMLELSLSKEIEITEDQFQMYVMDEWGWKDQFISTASSYLAKT